ncbi:MAG: extracellular solute-binding protein [Planctomycetota bacterium]|jgi:multiple sugar transport system permease protein
MESLRNDDEFRRNRNIAGKILTALGFVVVALAVWTVLSKKGRVADEGKVILNMWDLPTTNVTDPGVRADRAVHNAFLERHPEIKIVQTRGIKVYGPAWESAFYMAMAGGTAPDLFAINMRSVGSYIEQGFVKPLEEFIAEWPEADRRILPVIRPAISRNVVENGKQVTHIYAVPSQYYLMGCYYRKAHFQEAGLPIDGAPPEEWDWNMLWEYGKKTTFPKEGRFGLNVPMGLYGGWMWMPFVWQAGGDIVREYGEHPVTHELIPMPRFGAPESEWFTEDGVDLRTVKHVWKATYHEPPGVTALDFYRKLRWAPWTRCNSPECRGENICYDITEEMLDSGVATCPECDEEVTIASLEETEKLYKGVMFVDPSVDIDVIFNTDKRVAMILWTTGGVFVGATWLDPDEVGLMPCPAGPTGIRANNLNAGMWGINSQLTDPAKIRAAWEYIRFQASEEAEGIRVATLIEAGQGRYVDPALLTKYGFEEFVKYVPKSWVSTYRQLKVYGRVEPYAPNYKNVQTAEMAIPIDAVFTKESADPKTVLEASAKKVNETIFQEIPPEVMRVKRRWAYGVSAVVVVAFGFVVVVLAKSVKGLVEAAATRRRMGLKFAQTSLFAAWAFMVPAVATVFLWRYLPLVRGAFMAFMDYRVIGDSTWVGLDNFILLAGDPVFWESLLRTAFYVSLSIGLQFTAPIILALLLAEVPRGKIIYRVIYYLPAVTSGLVIMFLWKKFYDPSTGLFNSIFDFFGLPRSQWLSSGNGWLPMVCVVIPMVWASAGPRCLIYLAALKSVPEEMYEAADIDGASTFQKIWRITLPYLKPLIIINFVGAFIGAFQAMQQIFVMTGGGPARSTHVIGLEIWYNAFMYLKFGYATAEAWLLGTLLIGFTVYQLRILKRVRFTTAKV